MRFLNTQHISAELGDLMQQATKELILISPYLRFSDNLKTHLSTAAERVPVTMVYGKEEKIHTETDDFLIEIGCEVWFVKDLHAKCVLNEQAAMLSSMNIYTYSQQYNWEMGVAFSQEEHPEQFRELQRHVEMIKKGGVCKHRGGIIGKAASKIRNWRTGRSRATEDECACCGMAFKKKGDNPICKRCEDKIAGRSLPNADWRKLSEKLQADNKRLGRSFAAQLKAAEQSPHCINCGEVFRPKHPSHLICPRCYSSGNKPRKSSPPRRARPEHTGAFCIHCRKPLPFNPDKPMCYDCFKTSSSKPARYCHHCGQEARTQLRQPVCGRCVELGYEVDETVVM